jgi:NADH dehydrogenase [ubiquinone] 1 alpha subcomplex assembly factor 6
MATSPGYGERCVLPRLINRETAKGESRSPDPRRLSAVAALVRRHDRDRFQTALFAPAGRREALFALYAFNYEIARVRETVSEPVLGQIRLQWWRESIAAAFEDGPVRGHIVVEPLTAAIRTHGLTRAHFDRLIDAREGDLDEAPLVSLADLESYAEATSARLVYLALESLGVRDPAAERAAFHIGIAYALAGLLRAIPYRTRIGPPLVPAEIAVAATQHLASARAQRRAITRSALPALLPAILAERSLTRLQRVGFDPFDSALAVRDTMQSWRLALAALRNRY